MTREQKQYLDSRLWEILEAKRAALGAKHKVPAVDLTVAQLIAGIKKGTIKPYDHLTPNSSVASHGAIFDLKGLVKPATHDEAYPAALKQLEDEHTKVRDQTMLADSKEALAALTAYANG